MKKSMLVLVMGLCGTVVFAQDAKTEISKEQTEVKMRPGAELKDKPAAKKGDKSLAEHQTALTKNKMKAHKTMVVKKVDMPAKLEEK